jgi:hypothetical protein
MMYAERKKMHNFSSQVKEEGRALLGKIGICRPPGWKILIVHACVIGAFGFLLPWAKGVEFMDPALPIIYACLGPFFGAPMAVQLVRQASPNGALSRVVAAVMYGEAMALILLLLGFVTVLSLHSQAYLFLPDPILVGEALLLGLGSTLALSALSAWVTLKISPRVAMTVLRLIFIVLFAVFLLRAWWLPAVAGTAAAVSFAIAAVFLTMVRREQVS